MTHFCEISVSDFKKQMQKSETITIDIRTKEEWEKYGVIEGTDKYIVFGHPLFEYQIDQLEKDKEYLLYCWHGNRSKQAMEIMKEKGFVSVYDLAGGIDAWISDGGDVVTK